jgi:hypothetical protein
MSTMPEYHTAKVSIDHWKAKLRRETETPTSDARMQKCLAKLAKWQGIMKSLQVHRRSPKPPKPSKQPKPVKAPKQPKEPKPPKQPKPKTTSIRPRYIKPPPLPPSEWVPTPLRWD